MLYITDKGHMNEIPEDVSEGDRVVVFCKETDSIRVLDMGRLLAAARLVPVEFVPADTKDEMLLAIGGMLEHEEMCTVLFPAGTIPKRYADKIKTVRRAAKKKPAKKAERKSRGKETPAAGKVKNEEAADKEAGGADAAKAPLPETETAADGKADAPAGKPGCRRRALRGRQSPRPRIKRPRSARRKRMTPSGRSQNTTRPVKKKKRPAGRRERIF